MVRRAAALAACALGAGLVWGVETVYAGKSSATEPYAFQLTGKVVKVADGDSFTISVRRRNEQVRMASIDAPEIGDATRPGQPMAKKSREALNRLIAGKTLTLECYERDHYGRSVCDVPLGGGNTANQLQVKQGMAWANMEGRGKFMRDSTLPDYQKQAQRAGLGIWGQRHSKAIAPWQWRYQCWKQKQC